MTTATQFKLSKANGLTRRLVFPDQPSWFALASRIKPLYDIPIEKIGVSYVDSDGDEVTLSSEEELQDFYQFSYQPGQPIRFAVQDLRSLREASEESAKPLPETPPNNNRNTFGQEPVPLMFEVEDDWQRIPGLAGLFMPGAHRPESPHAFVEVVDSDANSVANSGNLTTEIGPDTTMESDITELPMSSRDKGKAKAVDEEPQGSDSVSSAGSVLAADTPTKMPIHVYDVSHSGDSNADLDIGYTRLSTPADSPRSTAIPIAAESTPKAAAQVPASVSETEVSQSPTVRAEIEDAIPDPPLAPLDSPPTSAMATATASLSNDVATLLNSMTTVFSSHPELSEGLRNIVRNATNGTYWAIHRDAIARAADDIRRTAQEESGRAVDAAEDLRRITEEEAGRRVAEAVGGIMRAFGDITVSVRTNMAAAEPALFANPDSDFASDPNNNVASEAAAVPPNGNIDSTVPPPFAGATADTGFTNSSSIPSTGWGSTYLPPFESIRHGSRNGPLPPPRFSPGPPPPPGPPRGGFNVPPPPPPPPPPPFGQPDSWTRGPFPPHVGPFGPNMNHLPPPPPRGMPWFPHDNRLNDNFPARLDHAAWRSWAAPHSWDSPNARPNPYQSRAQVEMAKQYYKAEKERYRMERDERRKEREHRDALSGETVAEAGSKDLNSMAPTDKAIPPPAPSNRPASPVTQVVSNARGSFPQLEMFGVPPRRHGAQGGHRRGDSRADTVDSRAIQRVTRRLADMGFTEHAYPNLPSKVKAQMPANGVPTKDDEDNIVTTLLEEFLAMSPKQPVASGSGSRRDRDIPGAWH